MIFTISIYFTDIRADLQDTWKAGECRFKAPFCNPTSSLHFLNLSPLMVQTTEEWVHYNKNWDKNELCNILFCILIQKQLSSKSNFRIIIFVERIPIWKGVVTAWVSDTVLDLSSQAKKWHLEMLLFTCPPRKLASRNQRGRTVFTNYPMPYLWWQQIFISKILK